MHHVTFNRVFLINELIERGYGSWVLYLDTDTVAVRPE